MRLFAFAFICVLSLLTAPVSMGQNEAPGQAKGAPPAPAAKKPAAEAVPAPAWTILRFGVYEDGAQVTVKHDGTGESVVLKSVATNGDRLLSATFTTDELRVEAQIKGTPHSLTQKTQTLNRRAGAGPTEEDRKRYELLSDKARELFRKRLREKFSDPTFRNAPEKERRSTIRAIFEKLEKEDKAGDAEPPGQGASTPGQPTNRRDHAERAETSMAKTAVYRGALGGIFEKIEKLNEATR